MASSVAPPTDDTTEPFDGLRAYQAFDPWRLRDLATLIGTLLEASGVVPVNPSARARPSERTIRYYVSQGLVESPDGRGTAAVYRYRHLVQVLAVKLRQMEGATLETVKEEIARRDPAELHAWVAATLGPGLPTPQEVGALSRGPDSDGRRRRSAADQRAHASLTDGDGRRSTLMRRLAIAPGAELALDVSHPLFKHAASDETVVQAVATALDILATELAEE